MNFIDIIQERGFVHQMTDEAGLATLLKTPGQVAYIGFDCTAKSLHVGSLLQIMLLRWWQKCGHKPIVLLGGFTTKVGDPSGKDEARKVLSDADIKENMEGIRSVFSTLLGKGNFEFVNNDDWFSKISYGDFLRNIASHFSVNRMMTMDSVKLRLEREQNLSALEFNYMMVQAYDFVELHKTKSCRVQMGGSDQWGNIVSGTDLNRRIHAKGIGQSAVGKFAVGFGEADTGKEVFGITSPLITTSSGAKMGKTAAGAVWLNADLCSPYDYWQFWRNTEDGDVIRFLKLFTEIPLAQIREYEAWIGSAKINDAKIILATEATALLHGRLAAEKAAATAAETFSGSGVSENLPEITISENRKNTGIEVYELLVLAGFAASNGEAKRLIQGNGVRIDDEVVEAKGRLILMRDFEKGFVKLSKGKKQHVLVKIK